MFARLAATALLWSNLVPRFVLAQDRGQGGFGQIPICAESCIAAVAKNQNCILTTPECLCPSQFAIENCIDQECAASLSDLSTSLSIVAAFCLGATSSSPLPSSKPSVVIPPPVTPNTSGTPASSTPSLPATSTSGTTRLSQSPMPSTQSPPLVSLTTSTTTTSSADLLATTPSITLTVPPPPLSSQAQPTVVVFSTQFAPPQPSSNGSVPGHSTVGVFINILVSSVVGIFVL